MTDVDVSAETTPAAPARLWADLQAAVGRAVVGADEPLRLIAIALLAEGHVLIEDVPGTGKTLLARAIAAALDLGVTRIQGTPDLLPSDVTGASVFEGGSLRFVPGPVFTNILLFDEINRATPRTQSALLEAMQEHQVSIEGVTRPLPEPFICLATQNPVEFEGTFGLPQAQLDRFLLRTRIGYPSESEEGAISRRYQDAADPLEAIVPIATAEALLLLQERVRRIRVAAEVEAYAVALVRATRSHPDITLGGSPRASVALHRAGQAAAVLDGRSFVLPDDIKSLAGPVLTHRIVVDLDRGLRGATPESVVADVLESVPVPPLTDGR